jgi:hypothetical protein
MTWDEARLLEAIATAFDDPRGAALLLRQAKGSEDGGALVAAQAVAAAFSDLGRPLKTCS